MPAEAIDAVDGPPCGPSCWHLPAGTCATSSTTINYLSINKTLLRHLCHRSKQPMADTVALQIPLWRNVLYSLFAQRGPQGVPWPEQGGEGIERNTVAQPSLQAAATLCADNASTCSFGLLTNYLEAMQTGSTMPNIQLRTPLGCDSAPNVETLLQCLLDLLDLHDRSYMSVSEFVGTVSYLHLCVLPIVPQVLHTYGQDRTAVMGVHMHERAIIARVARCPYFSPKGARAMEHFTLLENMDEAAMEKMKQNKIWLSSPQRVEILKKWKEILHDITQAQKAAPDAHEHSLRLIEEQEYNELHEEQKERERELDALTNRFEGLQKVARDLTAECKTKAANEMMKMMSEAGNFLLNEVKQAQRKSRRDPKRELLLEVLMDRFRMLSDRSRLTQGG